MASCINPWTKKNTTARKQGSASNPIAKGNITYPCGKCAPCLQRKQQEWAFRLNYEDKDAITSYFYTITYHDLFLVTDIKSHVPTLVKEHAKEYIEKLKIANLQEVMKDLNCTWRKAQQYEKANPFKYFIVGEYGSQLGRPHYHAYIKNIHPRLANDPVRNWEKGEVLAVPSNPATIAYLTKYLTKPEEEKTKTLSVLREFSLKSKGLGSKYIQENKDYHKNHKTAMTKFQGRDSMIPRYFKDKIFSDYEKRIVKDRAELALNDDFWKQVQRMSKFKESKDAWLEYDAINHEEAMQMHQKSIQTFKSRKL